jgi:transposase
MDFKIRTTKTKSGKIAVQVINYTKRKVNVLKHIGSAKNEEETRVLKEQAENWIRTEMGKKGLFKIGKDSYFSNYQYLGFTYAYAYEFLEKIYHKFNFQNHVSGLFKDLVIARILEPKSKRDSLEFLQTFLGITHSENVLYKMIAKHDDTTKDNLEKEIVKIAKSDFGFDFSFVLYDVTTLYFESFKSDDFKKSGFSKDHKHNQPQIVIGLMVTKDGFPLSYEVFPGNTFEGNTFLPCILNFKKKHNIAQITVVADSAMISKQNLDKLLESGLNYIIASRLANLKESLINKIDDEIKRTDGNSVRIDNLVVDYSCKRYRKDKAELDKQIEKAKLNLNARTEKISNIKYLKNDKVARYINQELIDKNTKLLGLKGYVTNLKKENKEIVDYYHNLVKIEHAFRIAKSDLEARPIYHHKEKSIKNHMLICFMALAMSVYLELKNKRSTHSIVEELKSVTDAKILNVLTNEVIFDRVKDCGKVKSLEDLSY